MSTRKTSDESRSNQELLRAVEDLSRKMDQLLSTKNLPLRGSDLEPSLATGRLAAEIDQELDRCMVRNCDGYVKSRGFFTDFLDRSAALAGEDKVEESHITEMRRELERARANSPYNKCSICFDGVGLLFERHIRLARTQNSYVSEANLRALIDKMDEESVVRNIIDPLSNPQRLEMMKWLNSHPMTYSMLSQRTGLKGGNLLFHIQKLLAAGFIAQDQDRGDYSLTERGSKVLRYLTMMTLDLGSVKWA
jgi:DNA-binding transcriptional ArsR family regulator